MPLSSHMRQPGITDQLRCAFEKGGKNVSILWLLFVMLMLNSNHPPPPLCWKMMVMLKLRGFYCHENFHSEKREPNNEMMRRPQNLGETILINVGR